MSTRQKEREATSDVLLSEDLSHVKELPQGKDFFECYGAAIMGESQGYDLLLLVYVWRVGGGRQGKWMVDDVLMPLTTFVVVPQDQQGKMRDTDFISHRQDPREWVDDVKIVQKPDRIIWQTGNRQNISRPPYWEIKGEHMGVETDLILGGIGKSDHYYGPWSDLPKTLRAGYDQRCWVEGTIKAGGRVYNLEKGYASHELMTFGETWDHTKIMREPYTWICCANESMYVVIMSMPDIGFSYALVQTGGKEIHFSPGQVSLDVLERWEDPRNLMRVPVRWHANMNSADGIVDMDIAAGGRGLFCMVNRAGYSNRYAFNARSKARVFLPDGQSVPTQDMLTFIEWGKTVHLEPGAP